MATGRGGKRAGAGRPMGALGKATLSKIEAREIVRQAVMKHADQMVEAQVANAMGLKYLVVRQKTTGKFVRVTEAMAKAKQGDDDGTEVIEVWEKDPSVQAFTDLMNRYLDKPKEQEQAIEHSGSVTFQWQGE